MSRRHRQMFVAFVLVNACWWIAAGLIMMHYYLFP